MVAGPSEKETTMRRGMEGALLLSGAVLMFVVAGCCGDKPPAPAPMEPEPVVVAPPPAPRPPPAPPVVVVEPPPPPPAPLPPATLKKIQDLGEKYPGLFRFEKDKGLFYFDSDLTFDSGSAVVKPNAKAALGKLAEILAEDEVKDRRLTIVGHTDTDRVVKQATIDSLKKLGKTPDNKGLSEARAEAVAAVLQSGGIATVRMTTQGKGETAPIADNRTPDGKARNRRVEIYITPAPPQP
jgi:OmpA-OmpF porin, OOP family